LLKKQYDDLFNARKEAYVEFLNFIEAEERYGRLLSPEEWMSKLTRMGSQILLYGSKKIALEMSKGFTPDPKGKTAPALYDVKETGNEFRRKIADMIIEEMATINVTRISDNWLEKNPPEEARAKSWWRFWI
jgi:hypothetical protein